MNFLNPNPRPPLKWWAILLPSISWIQLSRLWRRKHISPRFQPWTVFMLLFVSSGYAQIKSAHSIIIKFKSEATMATPSVALQSALQSISPQNFRTATRIFQKTINGNIQSVNEIDPELARIIILPVSDNIDIQKSADKISAFVGEIEYAEPNYIYHIDGVPVPNDS